MPLAQALGRVLAEDVSSADDVPGFDNSAMDGFAVRAQDTAGAEPERPVRLAIAGESRAGRPSSRTIGESEAALISTGAMLPAGADAVVRKENAHSLDGAVEVLAEVQPGKEIRRAGEDIRAGDVVLRRGARLGPAEIGVLASVGLAEAPCVRRPRLAAVVTGDELVEPGRPLGPGQIRDSNAYTVPAQAERAGAEVASVTLAPDDRESTVRALRAGLEEDVLVVCGGVSVGAHDHVKGALADLGVEQVFWGVALRPGHPTWFGVAGRKLVFGLPGNPVSAMVTFHLFVRPAIAALGGAPIEEQLVTGVMDDEYRKPTGRAHVVRCRLEARDDGWHVRPTKEQGSHVLTSMVGAQALALLEVERGDVAAGERVRIAIL